MVVVIQFMALSAAEGYRVMDLNLRFRVNSKP